MVPAHTVPADAPLRDAGAAVPGMNCEAPTGTVFPLLTTGSNRARSAVERGEVVPGCTQDHACWMSLTEPAWAAEWSRWLSGRVAA